MGAQVVWLRPSASLSFYLRPPLGPSIAAMIRAPPPPSQVLQPGSNDGFQQQQQQGGMGPPMQQPMYPQQQQQDFGVQNFQPMQGGQPMTVMMVQDDGDAIAKRIAAEDSNQLSIGAVLHIGTAVSCLICAFACGCLCLATPLALGHCIQPMMYLMRPTDERAQMPKARVCCYFGWFMCFLLGIVPWILIIAVLAGAGGWILDIVGEDPFDFS